MALAQKSLFLYGFEVTSLNSSIDFKTTSMGSEKNATLNLGFYSLTSLMEEIVRAMGVADASQTYTVTANRNVSGGLENRVTIAATGGFLSLLFASGSRAASSTCTLIGFLPADQTGAATYTGSSSAGTRLVTTYAGYNYGPPDFNKEIQGAHSISASGVKESIVFQIMKFISIEFKYEAKAFVLSSWVPMMDWAIQQRSFEFTPEYDTPGTFYEVTLEQTAKGSTGMAYSLAEMLPQFPNLYQTGPMRFRQRISAGQFII